MLPLLLNPDILDLCCVFDAYACVSVGGGTFAVLICLHHEDFVSEFDMLEFGLGAVARFVGVAPSCGRLLGEHRGCGSDP